MGDNAARAQVVVVDRAAEFDFLRRMLLTADEGVLLGGCASHSLVLAGRQVGTDGKADWQLEGAFVVDGLVLRALGPFGAVFVMKFYAVIAKHVPARKSQRLAKLYSVRIDQVTYLMNRARDTSHNRTIQGPSLTVRGATGVVNP